MDTYDNSILYTDWFLSELISILSARNIAQLAAVFFGPRRKSAGRRQGIARTHPRNKIRSFDLLLHLGFRGSAEAPPSWMSNVAQHAALPLSLSNLSHSMLELADIHAPAMDLQMSMFNSTFALHPRSYLQGGEVRGEPPEMTATALSILTPDQAAATRSTWAAGLIGIVTEKRAPCPMPPLSAEMVPPSCCAATAALCRPKP